MARVVEWRPTKIMNMRDLSNDDDFISHLLVEKLGTGAVPLYVHKMDPTRRLPKTDAAQLLHIVRRVRCWSYLHIDGLIDGLTDLSQLVLSRSSLQNAVRHAIDELLLCVLLFLSLSLYSAHPSQYSLPPVRYYLRSYTQKQINAFATCAFLLLSLSPSLLHLQPRLPLL